MNKLTYTTDPSRRCKLCHGREVKAFLGDDLMSTSLETINDDLYCKNKKECQENIEAENTQILVSEKGYKVVDDYDKPIFEVEYTDDKAMWEDVKK